MTTANRRVRSVLALVASAVALVAITVPASASGPGPVVRARPRVPAWPVDVVPGSLLVTGVDGTVDVVRVAPGDEAATAARLRRRTDVAAVEPDHLRPMLRVPNDPGYAEQWGHTMARAPAAWDLTTGSPTVQVAVIDSGVDGTHPDLRPNLVAQVDVTSGTAEVRGLGLDNDRCGVGHGTMVAGLIGAAGNNAQDVAGVAWQVGIVDIAAGDPVRCGSFSDSAVITAVEYAITRRVDVINLSLGGPSDACPTAFQAAIDAARAQNIVIVAAAGNEQREFPGIYSVPASCNGVIAVGAVTEAGGHASYSNANAQIDLAAPGGELTAGRGIVSTRRGGGTQTVEGTSFAAPYVAGAAALVRSIRPGLPADAVEALLETTAVRPGGRRTDRLGWGRLDVGAAVARAVDAPLTLKPAADPRFPVGLVVRVSAQEAQTEAVRQAVAVSRFVFAKDRAQHAVLARRDDFADALAGSALGFGAGPVLFTDRTGPLDSTTAVELQRVLPEQGLVYLLGGTAAIPARVEDDLRRLGLRPRRLAGPTREATAAVVAREVVTRVQELGFDPPTRAILATARQWPDAVTAGSLAAWFGYPVLLTGPDALSPATREVLAALRPHVLYVVGGTAAVSAPVAEAARQAGNTPTAARLAGPDRAATAVAVARQFTTEFRDEAGFDPLLAVGVNLRRADGFAHVLSASSALGAFSGVYLPVEGKAGDQVPSSVVGFACGLDPIRGIVAGDSDIVSEPAKLRLNDLLEHTARECR